MRTGTFEFLDRYGLFAELLIQKADHAKMTEESAPLAFVMEGINKTCEERKTSESGAMKEVLLSNESKNAETGEGHAQALKVIET